MQPIDHDLGTRNLRLEHEGVIAWLTIDRPNARNSFTPSMYFGIKKAIHFVNAHETLRALIITGTGDSFLAEFDAASWDRNGFREPFEHRH